MAFLLIKIANWDRSEACNLKKETHTHSSMGGFHVQSTKSSKALQMFQGNCVNYHRNSIEYLLNTFLTIKCNKVCKETTWFMQKICKFFPNWRWRPIIFSFNFIQVKLHYPKIKKHVLHCSIDQCWYTFN